MEQFYQNFENYMVPQQPNFLQQQQQQFQQNQQLYDQQSQYSSQQYQQQQFDSVPQNEQIQQQFYQQQQQQQLQYSDQTQQQEENDYDNYDDYDEDNYNDEDYDYQEDDQQQNAIFDMLTPEQSEQFQLFMQMYQQMQQPQQQQQQQQEQQYQQQYQQEQMSQFTQLNQVPEPVKPQQAPVLTVEQFPSLQTSKNQVGNSGSGLGLKKKKMRLNPNANAFVPGQESNQNFKEEEEKEESYGEWDRPLVSDKQKEQQQMMNQWQMMNSMNNMNYMNQQFMNMGFPMLTPMQQQQQQQPMQQQQQQAMFQQFPMQMYSQQISFENMKIFQHLAQNQQFLSWNSIPLQQQQPKRHVHVINKTFNNGIVSLDKNVQAPGKKPYYYKQSKKQGKSKGKQPSQQQQERKPRSFKKKPEEQQQQQKIKKQMVTEESLLEAIKGFDYSSGLLHQVDESRSPLNIVFIGHVDAGKSTICGNILLQSGKVDPNDLKKFEQEAKSLGRDTWFLAYVMDISQEERAKGKTVEVGKATFTTASKRFTLLDAPGHKNYVPNMLAGASQSDVACLVVSAKTGEFESGFERDGQTREHAMLVRSLGCKSMIVVVNKMDECEWSKERYSYIQEQLSPFLEKQCGLAEKEISWCAISGMTGENIQEKNKENAKADWYQGLTLFELLDSVAVPARNPNTELRIPVLDQMKDMGQYLFGKVESGILVQGHQVTMMPYQKVFTVQSIFNADDQLVPYGKPGENLKLKVKDIDEDDIKRGFIICNNEDFCQFCYELEAELQLLELPDHKQLMSAGYSCVLHLHTIMEEVEISHVIAKKVDGQTQATTFLRSGLTGIVRIKAKQYLCVEKYSKDTHLGSFTLRDEGRTIALGKILRLKPAKKLPRVLQPTEKDP